MIYKINNLRLSIIHKTNNSNQYTIPSIKINLLFNVMKIIIKIKINFNSNLLLNLLNSGIILLYKIIRKTNLIIN